MRIIQVGIIMKISNNIRNIPGSRPGRQILIENLVARMGKGAVNGLHAT